MYGQSWYFLHPTFVPKSSGSTGRQFKTKLELKKWFYWAHQSTNQRRQAFRGTIGSKSCDPQPPFERRGRRSKGGWRSQLFDPMVPLFWFWPLPEPVFGFGRRSKEGCGSQLFDQWNQWMRSFGFGPSRSPFLVLGGA